MGSVRRLWLFGVLKRRPTMQLVPQEAKRQVLDESIADRERRRARKVQFFDEERHKYGQLWMSSGLKQRTKNNGRLDIVLIDIKSIRIGDNAVPDVSAWPVGQAPTTACAPRLRIPHAR